MSETDSKKAEDIKTVKVDVAAVIAEVKKNGHPTGPLADAVRAAAANLPDTEPPPPPPPAAAPPKQVAPAPAPAPAPGVITVVRGIIG